MDTAVSTIVLAVGPKDEDDRLDDLARATLQLASDTDANVLLTHVFTHEEFDQLAADLDYPKPTQEDVGEILDRHESIRYLEGLFDEHDIDHEVSGVVGDVSDGIVRTALEADADRVFLSGQRRTPVGKAVFGSVLQSVLLEAPCPVTYVRPAEE